MNVTYSSVAQSLKAYLLWFICIASFIVNSTGVNAADISGGDEYKLLWQVCTLYTDNWQGLRYHYKGKAAFSRACYKSIQNKDFLGGLWAIRALIPDGHADFAIDSMSKSKIYPVALVYDSATGRVLIWAVYKKTFKSYLGKTVVSINDRPVMDVIRERAAIEPQSTKDSSLEFAARNITFSYRKKPNPTFPQTMSLAFEDGSVLKMDANTLYALLKNNDYLLTRNGVPSIWGSIEVAANRKMCHGSDDDGMIIDAQNKKWLWWHPRSMYFDLDNLEKALYCWNRLIKKAEGVVVDLRDTAGGEIPQVMTISHILAGNDRYVMKILYSKGKESLSGVRKDNTLRVTTPMGLYEERVIDAPANVSSVVQWRGPLVVMINGICGSSCDILVKVLRDSRDACFYGTPTAGRLIGYSGQTEVSDYLSVVIPTQENLQSDGSRWEGKPMMPDILESGDVQNAIEVCGK